MHTIRTRRLVWQALLATLATSSCGAFAQPANSDKPIRMIVPLAAGSTVDAVARALGPGLMVLDKGPDVASGLFQSELLKHQKLVKQSGATLD